jgi:hypothetical protein
LRFFWHDPNQLEDQGKINIAFHLLGELMKLQRLGGYAAIAAVCADIAAFVPTILIQRRFGDVSDPVKIMAAYSAAPGYGQAIALLLIICYILLLIWVFALHEHMKADAPYLTRAMLIAMSAAAAAIIAWSVVWIKGIGIIAPARDISAYRAFDAITTGILVMGGHLSGWTCMLIGCAILRTRALSRIPGWLIFLTGVLWIPRFMVPQIGLIVDPLSLIACVWVGIALIRQKQSQPGFKEMAASK